MAKTPMNKKAGTKKFTGYMLPLSLTKQIRKLTSDRNKAEKKSGSRLTTQSDIVAAALCEYL
jgi:hypothetical protein